jgi:hypothetical protein
MHPRHRLPLSFALLTLAAPLSAQTLFTFDSSTQGWGATTWSGNGSQTVTAVDGQLEASYDSSGYVWLTNIWTNDPGSDAYQSFNAAFADPLNAQISFDVILAPDAAPGATYFEIIAGLQAAGGEFKNAIIGSFTGAERSSGAVKTFITDYTLAAGTTTNAPGAANYQFLIGVNSDWSGGSIRIDNVELGVPVVIPEPRAFGFLAGLSALALGLRRRR